MQTAHEFFLHELGDMLDAERKLAEALGKQAEESSRPELKKAFENQWKRSRRKPNVRESKALSKSMTRLKKKILPKTSWMSLM